MNPTRTLLFLVLMGVSVSYSASVSKAAEIDRLARFKEVRELALAEERENLRMGTLPGLKNSPSKKPTNGSSATAKPKTDSPSTTKDHLCPATPPKKFDHLSPTAQAKPINKQAARHTSKDATKPTVAAKPAQSAPAAAQVNTQPATRTTSAATKRSPLPVSNPPKAEPAQAPAQGTSPATQTPSAASATVQPAVSKKAVTFSTASVKSDNPFPTKMEEEPASVDPSKARKKSLTKKLQEPYDYEFVNSSTLSDLTATDTDLPYKAGGKPTTGSNGDSNPTAASKVKEDASRTEFFWTLLYGSIIVLLSGSAIAVLRMRHQLKKEKTEQLQNAP